MRELAPSRRELRQEKKEKKHLEEQEKEAEKLEQKHQKELRKQERQEKAAEKRQELKQQKEERRQEKEEQQRLKSIVVFDTATTGFQPDDDELLQFSAIDGSGTVLFETYIKPENKRRWPYAQKVNGISPSMVANAPSINEVKSKILRILNSAKILVGYNINFDLSFLQNEIAFKPSNKQEIFDVMEEFATAYGDLYGNHKRKKLVDAASSYGYEYNAHDSLEDARATLFVYNKLNNHEQPAKIPDKISADNKKFITIDDDQTNDELFDSLSNENKRTNFLIYHNKEEDVSVNAIIKDETIWLTQKAMAKLFGVDVPAISKHLLRRRTVNQCNYFQNGNSSKRRQ